MRTEEELDQITADKNYWLDVGEILGIRLTGWTGRTSAQFLREDGSTVRLDPWWVEKVYELMVES